VLYIGQSKNIRSRFIQHASFIKILLSNYGEITISYSETNNRMEIEKELIKLYKPLYNGNCRNKKISSVIEQVKNSLYGRKLRWLSLEIKMPEQDLGMRMKGKALFTKEEIDAINARLKSKIKL
jgi:hypothetical protein